MLFCCDVHQGSAIGGGRGQSPPEGFKEGKNKKYGVFLCIIVIKLAFLSSLRKYMRCKGFHYNFSSKKVSKKSSAGPPILLCLPPQ